ncbi:MAG: TonB-dependent receptor [Bryobacteraceae bacterium]
MGADFCRLEGGPTVHFSGLQRAALLFAAAVFLANAESAVISGVTKDSSGAAVAHAKVTLQELTGSAISAATSDSAGHFTFNDVAPGDYLLDASAPGLTSARPERLSLSPDETKRVTLELVVSAVRAQVSVTAANLPESVDRVSKQLEIVNPKDAEGRGILSVPDALRYLPGVRVITLGGPGTFASIQIRGMRSYDTAVLFDGFRFRDPTSVEGDATAYIGDLMLVDSSRIEVLQGSGSSLYVTNAMAGTINVITDPGGGPFHGDVDAQGGGLGLFRGLARFAGGALHNRLMYSAGVSNLNVSDGVNDAAAVRDWSGQGAISYILTPNIRLGADIFANTGYQQQNLDPYPIESAVASGITPASTVTFVPSLGDPDRARYSHFLDSLFRYEQQVNSRLSCRAGYNLVDVSRDNTDGPGGPDTPYEFQPLFNNSDRYTGRVDTLQARADYLLGAHQVLTAGYEFERDSYLELAADRNPDPSARVYTSTRDTQRSNAVFAQDQLRYLGNRLEILFSGRYTQDTLTQPAFIGGASPYASIPLSAPPGAYTGDASIAYFFKTSSTKIRAHAGNSFRMPSIYERFGGFFYGGTYFPIGDPNLAPERALSGDFGFDQYFLNNRLRVSGDYFYSELQQIVGYLNFSPGYVDRYGRTGGYYDTQGGISRGLEISGEFHPARRTSVFASYTYTKSQDRVSQFYTGTQADPLQMPGVLPVMFSIVATQQFGSRIDLAADFQAGSAYLYPLYGLEGYAYRFHGPRLLGVSGGYTIPVNDRVSVRLYARVSNALNQKYFEEGFQTPRRWAVAGLHFAF